jgi:Tfp pilus assembly protein PilW
MKNQSLRRKRGTTLIEVVNSASISVLTLIGGVACFMSGMMSWTKGVGAMDSINASQNATKLICQQLREAMSVSITNNGNTATYTLPSKDESGSYLLPLASDGVNRQFNVGNDGILSLTTGTSTRKIAANILSTDPATSAAYSVFTANGGVVTRRITVQVVTSKQGFRNNWTPSRSRESVYLRNVPDLSR